MLKALDLCGLLIVIEWSFQWSFDTGILLLLSHSHLGLLVAPVYFPAFLFIMFKVLSECKC